jgi:hypothetical protein
MPGSIALAWNRATFLANARRYVLSVFVPLGSKSHLPMPICLPTYAGTGTSAGGLVFFAGFQDYYLRAYARTRLDDRRSCKNCLHVAFGFRRPLQGRDRRSSARLPPTPGGLCTGGLLGIVSLPCPWPAWAKLL